MTHTRRAVLTSAGAVTLAGLAGCTSPGQTSEPTLTIRVSNQTDAAETVTIRVTDSDGAPNGEVTERTIEPGVSIAVERGGTTDEQYKISVTGERWATGSLWTPESCRDYTVITTLSETEGTPSVDVGSVCEEAAAE